MLVDWLAAATTDSLPTRSSQYRTNTAASKAQIDRTFPWRLIYLRPSRSDQRLRGSFSMSPIALVQPLIIPSLTEIPRLPACDHDAKYAGPWYLLANNHGNSSPFVFTRRLHLRLPSYKRGLTSLRPHFCPARFHSVQRNQ